MTISSYRVKDYAWQIIFLIISISFVKKYLIEPYLNRWKERRSYEEGMNPERIAYFQAERERKLEQQQEEIRITSQLAKEKEDKKRLEEKEKRRIKDPSEKKYGKGHKLGSVHNNTDTSINSYNPMNPWSSSSGPSYRPSRRSASRS